MSSAVGFRKHLYRPQEVIPELQRNSLTAVEDVIERKDAAERMTYASLEVRDIDQWYARSNETYSKFQGALKTLYLALDGCEQLGADNLRELYNIRESVNGKLLAQMMQFASFGVAAGP